MKKLLLIIALTILGLGLNAQKGGGYVEYIIDFNDYKTGIQCLNGQDNWLTHYQTAGTSADFDVDYTGGGLLSPDESVAVFYPYGGVGVGRTATRKASENFGFNFKNGGIIDLEFDISPSWWGAYVGVGFDADGDGHILQGMTEGDGGIYLRVAGSGNDNHPNIVLPNGDDILISNYQQTNWARYKMSFDFSAFDGAGSLTVFVKDFDGTNWSEWTQLAEATELNMGLTPGSGDMRDYQVWDGIFMHSFGAMGAFDNLLVRQGFCVPENLVATSVSTSSIILTWDNVENAISYNVYRDNDLIANVKYTEYTDTDLEIYTEYCYTVTAVCNESESNKSEEVCATTFDLPIMAPQNINANALSTSSIILTWDLVDNALSYNVYDGDIMIYNVTANVCAINNLKSDTEYCYTVTAVRNDFESDKSEEVCAKTMKEDSEEPEDPEQPEESIEELSSSFEIYPNPVEDVLFLATEINIEEIAIYDICGRAVRQQVNNTIGQQVIDVADLEPGVYFVNIKTENDRIVKRFVKK